MTANAYSDICISICTQFHVRNKIFLVPASRNVENFTVVLMMNNHWHYPTASKLRGVLWVENLDDTA